MVRIQTLPATLPSKLLIVILTRTVTPVVSQKEIHKPLVSAERNRPGRQELVKGKERLIKNQGQSQAGSLEPPDGWGWLLVVSPWGSQGEAGISWVRARVSSRELEISPERPRCLLEVRHEITPRCGPGLATGGLWGRLAGQGRGQDRE